MKSPSKIDVVIMLQMLILMHVSPAGISKICAAIVTAILQVWLLIDMLYTPNKISREQ